MHNLSLRPSQTNSTKVSQVANDKPQDAVGSYTDKISKHFDNEYTIEKNEAGSATSIADLIGEFGLYQLSLTILTFIRYVCVAMMTNSGPLIAPTLEFWCQPPDATGIIYPKNITNKEDYLKDKCHIDTFTNGTTNFYNCDRWKYNMSDYGVTLTDTFDLVCDRDWLRSAFQGTVSVGVVIASIVFGSFSDEHGRKFTLNICYAISLVAGSVSVIAPNFTTYAISRSICSMSDLGLVSSLYTIIVETLGNKYRGTICIIVYTGWSMGVMIMPWITGHFLNFRHVMLFTVVCHLLTLPWLLTVGESTRWLLVNGRVKEAEQEVERMNRWNSSVPSKQKRDEVKNKFDQMKVKFIAIAERKRMVEGEDISRIRVIARSLFGSFKKVGQIFESRELSITTITIVWTTFNSELMYMLFIMINSDVGDNVKLNYAIGGLMEILATLIVIVMISSLKRRFSLSFTLVIISMSIFCLAFTHQHPAWSIPVLNFTKLAISTLSSLIFVIATELFPTSLRQTGIGLAATLGSCGAVVAPFIRKELTDMIGMTNVMLILFLLPLSAALIIPFFLRETKDVELPDDIDEIVDGDTRRNEEPAR